MTCPDTKHFFLKWLCKQTSSKMKLFYFYFWRDDYKSQPRAIGRSENGGGTFALWGSLFGIDTVTRQ